MRVALWNRKGILSKPTIGDNLVKPPELDTLTLTALLCMLSTTVRVPLRASLGNSPNPSLFPASLRNKLPNPPVVTRRELAREALQLKCKDRVVREDASNVVRLVTNNVQAIECNPTTPLPQPTYPKGRTTRLGTKINMINNEHKIRMQGKMFSIVLLNPSPVIFETMPSIPLTGGATKLTE